MRAAALRRVEPRGALFLAGDLEEEETMKLHRRRFVDHVGDGLVGVSLLGSVLQMSALKDESDLGVRRLHHDVGRGPTSNLRRPRILVSPTLSVMLVTGQGNGLGPGSAPASWTPPGWLWRRRGSASHGLHRRNTRLRRRRPHLARQHLLIKRCDRHPADDVVGGGLIGAVDDVALTFVTQHRPGRDRAIGLCREFAPGDLGVVEDLQGGLDQRYKIARLPGRDMGGVLDETPVERASPLK